MRLASWTAIIWLPLFYTLTEGVFVRSTSRCAPNEYWCQDRCGSDDYGNTCCETPDGQHNLCGTGTICCMYGCCPAGTVCNAVGGCDPLPGPGSPPPPWVSTITAHTIITEIRTCTESVTLTWTKPCSSTPLSSISRPCNNCSGKPSTPATSEPPIAPPTPPLTGNGTRTSQTNTRPSPTTWTRSDGQVVVSSSGVVVIGTNPPITLPSVSSLTTLTTGGETVTLSPSPPAPSGEPTTWTRPDGQTVVSSSGVVQIGTNPPITLPSVSSLTTLTTGGETFTLSPSSGAPTGDGQTVVSSSGVVQIGTNPPITLPSIFTLSPTSRPTTTPTSATSWTRSDGQVVVSSPGGVIQIGTNTPFTLPLTFTLSPPNTNPTAPPTPPSALPTTWTRPNGETVVPPITLPTVTAPTTLTTGGEVFTLFPPGSSPPGPPAPPLSLDGLPLPTHTSFPPGIWLEPVTEEEVDDGEGGGGGGGGGGGSSCKKILFFPVCIKTPSINIGGWKFRLPPGIYPPGPPPFPNIRLPPNVEIKGPLPSWPRLTIGPDGLPTFPPQPSNCVTRTAEICATTSSVGPSTTRTTSDCAPITGCHVTDSDMTSTATCQSTATATSFLVSCTTTGTAPGSSSCTTISSAVTSGCSVTGTTSTTVASGSCVLLRTSTVTVEEPTESCVLLRTSTTTVSEPAPETTTTTSLETFKPTNLPTLAPNTDWITPTGSSCASTRTYTTCALPGNIGPACVTTSDCGSWVATSTTPPSPPRPTTTHVPLAVGRKRCYPRSDFPGHGDVRGLEFYTTAATVCQEFSGLVDDSEWADRGGVMKKGDWPMYYNGQVGGTWMWFSVVWREDCTTDADELAVWKPVASMSDPDGLCYGFMSGNWANCDNGGNGGFAEVGCLTYTFAPCNDNDPGGCPWGERRN
ncbi:hypothetical protein QBC34DRAFT_456777 [Podospora aff. communis PSN243]|uniref:Uncharacterized protein n=1 Tax=Podospora aff. communis PSN243 TaxID=3040156 RepID=A0AAV9G388_9PEZI|nr:hypothetical protein QBC34DRAFT_456777 [Podospora aff. communis PSN243]